MKDYFSCFALVRMMCNQKILFGLPFGSVLITYRFYNVLDHGTSGKFLYDFNIIFRAAVVYILLIIS